MLSTPYTLDALSRLMLWYKKHWADPMKTIFLSSPILIAITALPALTNTFIPQISKYCPVGSINVGAGYCKTQSNKQFIPRSGEYCPTGTKTVGAGYCKVN